MTCHCSTRWSRHCKWRVPIGSPADNQASSCRKLLQSFRDKTRLWAYVCVCVCVCVKKEWSPLQKYLADPSGDIWSLFIDVSKSFLRFLYFKRNSLQHCRGAEGGDELKVMMRIINTSTRTNTYTHATRTNCIEKTKTSSSPLSVSC